MPPLSKHPKTSPAPSPPDRHRPDLSTTVVMTDPLFGGVELLVHGECACGWRCACPEGWVWPRCPICGEQVEPPPRDGRLGYAARLMGEQEAVLEVRRMRGDR